MRLPTFKIGGIHPPQMKVTPADRIQRVELPRKVTILLKQHIGAEATPIVAKGDKVTRGQKIAEAVGKVSAPQHASISGTVTAIGMATTAQGRQAMSITITASDEDHVADQRTITAPLDRCDYSRLTPSELVATIANAGVVGLGGATFSTAVKLAPPSGSDPKVLIINGCECEPCLSCDDALMRAKPVEIIEGVEIMMKAAEVDHAIIGIENNKPEAYDALTKAAEGKDNIRVQLLQTKYPQGGEKQLIYALTGREVPSGALPISVNAIVHNVGTAYAVFKAVAQGQPLIERVVTIYRCGNYMVPIGMMITDIPAHAPDCQELADVIAGGPMMGQSIVTVEAPVTKGFSGISIVAPLPFDPDPCIRCGECVRACPMGLEPYLISTYGRKGLFTEAYSLGALDCIECGSCNYSCPSGRPILDFIRLSKMKAPRHK